MSEFPSPRGVELHKPSDLSSWLTQSCTPSFPSPRKVELHKPAWATKEVIR